MFNAEIWGTGAMSSHDKVESRNGNPRSGSEGDEMTC